MLLGATNRKWKIEISTAPEEQNHYVVDWKDGICVDTEENIICTKYSFSNINVFNWFGGFKKQ